MAEKKVSKFQIWVTAVGFLGLLFVPSVAWVFCHETVGEDKSENRTLATMPELTLKNIGLLPKEIEAAYNDHVPFRAPIRAMWAKLNYFGFGDSTNKNVVIGKNNGDRRRTWLFYSSDTDSNAVKDSQGLRVFDEGWIEKTVEKVRSETNEFKKRKIDLYYFVAPNKESVYNEMLPEEVGIFDEQTRTEKLSNHLLESGIKNYYFAGDDMAISKNDGQLYYRLDTHWNGLGAFVGFKGLVKMIEPKYKVPDFEIEGLGERREGDLDIMLNVRDFFVDENVGIKYLENIRYSKNETKARMSTILETDNVDAPIKKTIFVIGDSYRSAMEDYFAKTFSKVISLHREDYQAGMLDKYKPDIVVYEYAERYSVLVGNFAIKQ